MRQSNNKKSLIINIAMEVSRNKEFEDYIQGANDRPAVLSTLLLARPATKRVDTRLPNI